MPINRTISTPLTLISGSISVPSKNLATDGNFLRIPTSSFPPISASFSGSSSGIFGTGVWNHVIKTTPTFTTSAIQNIIPDMTIRLDNGFNYVIIGNFGISLSDATVGIRCNYVTSSGTIEVANFSEIPSSRTGIAIGNNASALPSTWPVSDIDNYYLVRTVSCVLVKSNGATFAPTLALSTAGANRTASMGFSVMSYMRY